MNSNSRLAVRHLLSYTTALAKYEGVFFAYSLSGVQKRAVGSGAVFLA